MSNVSQEHAPQSFAAFLWEGALWGSIGAPFFGFFAVACSLPWSNVPSWVCWLLWAVFATSLILLPLAAYRENEKNKAFYRKQAGLDSAPARSETAALKARLLALVNRRDEELEDLAGSNEPAEVKEEKARALLERYNRDIAEA